MTKNLAISARGLGKRYRLGSSLSGHDSLRDLIQAGARSLFRQPANDPKPRQEFWALDDVSFDIARGENVGIIGLNGAGKSTLLKILSRIVTPTEGTARIEGRLGALLEVGTGFHHELTGRENVYLYGAILGMSRQEVDRKFDAIVEFSEIADFIDTPVKRYSSGMYVRLAFSVAAHLEPDILLLDEVLAVGDFTFQRKCMDFAHALERKGATILFVSHNMFSIKSMCQRVIYLKKGKLVYDGPTDEGLKLYESDCRLAAAPWFHPDAGGKRVSITDIALRDSSGQDRSVFDFGEQMTIQVQINALDEIEDPNVIISITREDEVHCGSFSSSMEGLKIDRMSGVGTIELTTPPLKLVSDKYTISVVVRERGFEKMLSAQIGTSFHVKHNFISETAFGVFYEPASWRIAEMESRSTQD